VWARLGTSLAWDWISGPIGERMAPALILSLFTLLFIFLGFIGLQSLAC